MSAADFYRAWLRLLPRELRRAHGAEMAELFEQLLADARRAGRGPALRLWLRCLVGVVLCALAARRAGVRTAVSTRPRSPLPPSEEIHLVWLDLRTALRSFRKSPAFSVVTVALIAVGIGATTAIFSVVDGVLLRQLPYPEPDRLVYFDEGAHSLPLFRDWQESARSFDGIAAAHTESLPLVGDGEPRDVRAAQVTSELLPLFGAWAAEGRLLSEEDFAENRAAVVLSYPFWQGRFGGASSAVGETVDLDGRSYTVVGVLGPGFRPPEAITGSDVDLWIPLDEQRPLLQDRRVHTLFAAARLAPGATVETAQAELDLLATELAERYPDSDRGRDGTPIFVPLVPLREATVGRVTPVLLTLLGSVLLLLLIACSNVASLFLARATTREREIAVRAALGAGRLRLTRQLLTEALMLALTGGALGLALAWAIVTSFRVAGPEDVPRLAEVGVDPRALLFALATSIFTGVLFGTAPALRLARRDVHDSIRQVQTGAAARTQRLRSALVVAEIAMALVLLVGAGLLFNSFLRMSSVDPGFEADRLVRIWMRRGSFDPDSVASEGADAQRVAFARGLIEEIEALPDVTRAAAGWTVPFDFLGGGRCCWRSPFTAASGSQDEQILASVHPVTPGYFQVLGTPLLAGREIEWSDIGAERAPAVVNREMARRLFGDLPPTAVLDRTLDMGEEQSFTVVGVVQDHQHYDLRDEAEPAVFVSYAAFGAGVPMLSIAMRTTAPLDRLAESLRQTVWRLDPRQPIGDLDEIGARITQSTAEPRFYSTLLGLFATTSLLLAAGGIYGALLYSVSQRRRELGVRLALGAQRREIALLVLRQGGRIAAVGIGLGLVGALATSRVLESLLFGVEASDPLTLASVCGVLLVVALLACWVPARRAASVDPATTLRAD